MESLVNTFTCNKPLAITNGKDLVQIIPTCYNKQKIFRNKAGLKKFVLSENLLGQNVAANRKYFRKNRKSKTY